MKQASRQWYLKFDKIVTLNGFKENVVDQCIYLKVSKSSYIFLVLYVDDILLASNDADLLVETKHMLSNHFDMKDLGDASFVLGIQILRDRTRRVLKLSQRTYIEKVLKRFNMHAGRPTNQRLTYCCVSRTCIPNGIVRCLRYIGIVGVYLDEDC